MESDLPAVVEPSILFASAGGPRPTTQIKIVGDTGEHAEARWSFRRVTTGRVPRG